MTPLTLRFYSTLLALPGVKDAEIIKSGQGQLRFAPDATQGQIDTANAALAAFDWSSAPDDSAAAAAAALAAQIGVDKNTLKAAYSNGVTRLNQINAAAAPTNAQVIQAVRDMAQIQLQIMHVVKALI